MQPEYNRTMVQNQMTDASYPQVRIVSHRLLKPDTVESLLVRLVAIPGIRRIIMNGPSIPATVPYGPARGTENPHTDRRSITVGDEEIELRVQVGTFLLEVEKEDIIPLIERACEEVFVNFPYQLQQGRFMRSTPTQVDHAKYGPGADSRILGITDPSAKTGPTIIQGYK